MMVLLLMMIMSVLPALTSSFVPASLSQRSAAVTPPGSSVLAYAKCSGGPLSKTERRKKTQTGVFQDLGFDKM